MGSRATLHGPCRTTEQSPTTGAEVRQVRSGVDQHPLQRAEPFDAGIAPIRLGRHQQGQLTVVLGGSSSALTVVLSTFMLLMYVLQRLTKNPLAAFLSALFALGTAAPFPES